jgi:hypothetical protein
MSLLTFSRWQPRAARRSQPGGEDVAGDPAAFVGLLGPHRLDQPDPGDRVGPEQAVPRDLAARRLHHEIQLRPVQRAPSQPVFDLRAVAGDQRMGPVRGTLPADQPPIMVWTSND